MTAKPSSVRADARAGNQNKKERAGKNGKLICRLKRKYKGYYVSLYSINTFVKTFEL